MRDLDIEAILRDGANSFGKSLFYYWPSSGGNEVPEANITIHLAHSFLNNDFIGFAEAHSKDSTATRSDLLLIHPGSGTFVLCEFKRLYNAEKIESMIKDVKRIRKFKLQSPRDDRLEITQGYGVLACITDNPNYVKWWLDDHKEGLTDAYEKNFDRLVKEIDEDDIYWESFVLHNYCEAKELRQHALLYVIFPIDAR